MNLEKLILKFTRKSKHIIIARKTLKRKSYKASPTGY